MKSVLRFKKNVLPLHRFRRDGRVVDYSGLENRRTERYRGFESLSLRNEDLRINPIVKREPKVPVFLYVQLWALQACLYKSTGVYTKRRCENISVYYRINPTPSCKDACGVAQGITERSDVIPLTSPSQGSRANKVCE